jgi:hypothetical protein
VVCGCGGRQEPGPLDPDPPDLRIAIFSGDGQQAVVGTSLSDFLVVRVSDGPSEAVEGVSVEWSVLEGGGELSLKGFRTDRDGLASAVLFVGDQPGEQVIRAGLESGREVRFMAHALGPGPQLSRGGDDRPAVSVASVPGVASPAWD